MCSLLVKPEPELSPASLLVLCDLAEASNGRRRDARLWTLLGSNTITRGVGAPVAVKALIHAGLVEMRSKTGSWDVEITDRGLTLHRCLMAALRNSAVLIGGAGFAPTEPAQAGTTNSGKATGNHALASAATH